MTEDGTLTLVRASIRPVAETNEASVFHGRLGHVDLFALRLRLREDRSADDDADDDEHAARDASPF